ncbi:SIR2 family protein [Chitinophaga ginsengisegetis]|uniref:SIR2 family protein n=1 Tax=Chitinophaga ginsengisegetis TaxID=393003 RepID=UPI000DBAAFA2|nr:SIR2 family protein [Chitinophaga ginsengisegetis]MDR6569938.1 hypothetical protein [Chitinophaga ginsengisegetis]MDR6649671.1 hypothetical protein [Chitinophaga ginsengisegetis]MDR6656126.1 hypothetical protein [Chitinophaga ginsengisegetis]
MNWPKSLITEIAHRRCIIFLGSGASAASLSLDGAKRPPVWDAFLNKLIALIPGNEDSKVIISDLISKYRYLEAAEVIYELVPKADYTQFIRDELELPKYQASKIHEIVLDLDPKIVITTNYDKIYDNYCTIGTAADGYNISKYYDQHLTADLRSPIRTIIKAHGCVSDPSKVVLTKSQYFKARKDYPNFYKVLDALFLTHTILFIGYSLNDPDIQLLLENVNITAPTAHPHYFVMGDGTNEILKKSNKISYNLEFIEFPTGNYNELNIGLADLADKVQKVRETNPLA